MFQISISLRNLTTNNRFISFKINHFTQRICYSDTYLFLSNESGSESGVSEMCCSLCPTIPPHCVEARHNF